MSQKRLRDYEEDLGSFEHNIFNFGLHSPGRYCGFDTIEISQVQDATPLDFTLKHLGTGVSYKNVINNVLGPIGILMTPQGVLLQEDAPVELSIDTNLGNAEIRYDLVYCQHNYTADSGGEAAIYGIIKGAIGNPIKPVLPDPLKQIAIGVLEIPAGVEDITNVTWHKAKCPDSGDGEDARLDMPNMFQAFQGQSALPPIQTYTDTHINGGHVANLYLLRPEGNLYSILPPANAPVTLDGIGIKDIPYQDGMRISVMINEYVTLRESVYFLAAPVAARGYKNISIPNGLSNVVFPPNGGGANLWGVKPAANEIWELELLFYGGRWVLVKIGGAGARSQYVRGDLKWWFGSIGLNLDPTGLGVNLLTGWHYTNGLMGTPDVRGKGLVCAAGLNAAGAVDLSSEAAIEAAGLDPKDYLLGDAFGWGGKKRFKLTQLQLPDVLFPVDDPGHVHAYIIPSRNFKNDGDNGADLTGMDGGAVGTRSFTSVTALTGIEVSSGGNGDDIDLVNPHFKAVLLMKL